MLLRQRRSIAAPVAVLLVPAGVFAGHAAGYAAAAHVQGGRAATAAHSHGYLPVGAALATILAVVALAAAAAGVRGARRVFLRHLLALQWGALLLQEGLEHVMAGERLAGLLGSPALWFSLAAQLATAAGAALLARSASVVRLRLASFPGRARLIVPASGRTPPPPPVRIPPSHRGSTSAARGPPALPA